MTNSNAVDAATTLILATSSSSSSSSSPSSVSTVTIGRSGLVKRGRGSGFVCQTSIVARRASVERRLGRCSIWRAAVDVCRATFPLLLPVPLAAAAHAHVGPALPQGQLHSQSSARSGSKRYACDLSWK